MLWEVKIKTQYTNEFNKEVPLDIGQSVLGLCSYSIKARDLNIESQHSAEQGKAELRTFNLNSEF